MISIRLAASGERDALEALQRRASLNNPGDREALLANPDMIQLPLQQIVEGRVYMAEQAGIIKGFAALLPVADGDLELDALFVEPQCWRQGVGRALVEHCARVAAAAGARHLHVTGNPHAEGFYLACGFELCGTRPVRFGTGLFMKRTLR